MLTDIGTTANQPIRMRGLARLRSGALIAGLLVAGCAANMARSKVLSTASFDSGCPKEKINVVSENKDIWAYELDVCGERRKYRDFGNEKEFQFVDVTNGVPGTVTAPESR